jgi:hypothetical protein
MLYWVGYARYPIGYEGALFFSDTPFRVPSDYGGGGPPQTASFCNFCIFLQNSWFVNIYVYIYPRGYIDPAVSVGICNTLDLIVLKLYTLVLMLFRVFRVSGSYLYILFFFFFFFFF